MRRSAFLLVLLLLAVPAFAEEAAPDATKLFADGQALLAAGDLPKAFEAFAAAAKADPENKDYARQALVVRRVLTLRATVAKSEPSEKWEKMVISLHSFYLRNGLREHALTLDREAHGKAQSATTASLVAETLLEMDREAEAATLLKALPDEALDVQNRIYLAISLARLGQTDAAKAVAVAVPEDAGPGLLYDVARLHVLLGRKDEAIKTIGLCLEGTPATGHERLKGFFLSCRDFAPLKGTPELETVLATKSKCEAAGCGGGCSTCPKRGGCGKDG